MNPNREGEVREGLMVLMMMMMMMVMGSEWGGSGKEKSEENLVVLLSCEGVRAGEGKKDRTGSEMKKKVGCVARLLCCVGAVL